ncbi:MAG TPA: hypothetical protein VFA28_02220 [Bryobacteraceae bacterium]|nr:hypothetical protein [Bryobacteraceae bacterium]
MTVLDVRRPGEMQDSGALAQVPIESSRIRLAVSSFFQVTFLILAIVENFGNAMLKRRIALDSNEWMSRSRTIPLLR